MRQRVISSREYRGVTIQHIEEEVWRGTGWGWGRNHAARYVKSRYWWIWWSEAEGDGRDESTLREAKAAVDARLGT